MAQIGDEKYPELSVEDAVEAARILVNDFGGEVKSEEAWAQALGHSSSSSGTYYTKVADIRRYGLLPSRGLEATELAEKVANPRNEREEEEAIFEMLQSIGILSRVYELLNGGDPPEEFWRVLTEAVNTNPKEAREAAPTIRQLYLRMREAEENKEEEEKSREFEEETEEVQTQATIQPTPESAIYVRVGSEELRLSEASDHYIDLAKDFLERLKGSSDAITSTEDSEEAEQSRLTN